MTQATLVGALTGITVMTFAISVSMGTRALAVTQTRRRFSQKHSRKHNRHALDRKSASLMIIAASAIAAVALGIVPAMLTLVGGFVAVRVVSVALRHRSMTRYDKTIPFALDDAARSLRSGSGILQALSEAAANARGEVGKDLAVVVREVDLGRSIDDALDDWALRRPYATVRLCTGAMTLALETGGAPARAIDSVARTMREQLNSAELARSAAAEFQMTAYALSVIPLVITAGVIVFDDYGRNFFFHTPVGNIILVAGLLLNFVGLFAMNEMIRRAAR